MAFSLSSFKSNISSSGGGARPALYSIDINGASQTMSFTDDENILVKAASIPPANIAPLPVNYAGRAYKYSGFRTYDNWTVTVINDENFSIRNKMMHWMRGMSGKMDGTRNTIYGDPIAAGTWFDGDATVQQLGTDGKVKQTYKFDYLWPTEISGIPVDWSSDAIQEFTVTFAYDYWTHGAGTSSTSLIDSI